MYKKEISQKEIETSFRFFRVLEGEMVGRLGVKSTFSFFFFGSNEMLVTRFDKVILLSISFKSDRLTAYFEINKDLDAVSVYSNFLTDKGLHNILDREVDWLNALCRVRHNLVELCLSKVNHVI